MFEVRMQAEKNDSAMNFYHVDDKITYVEMKMLEKKDQNLGNDQLIRNLLAKLRKMRKIKVLEYKTGALYCMLRVPAIGHTEGNEMTTGLLLQDGIMSDNLIQFVLKQVESGVYIYNTLVIN